MARPIPLFWLFVIVTAIAFALHGVALMLSLAIDFRIGAVAAWGGWRRKIQVRARANQLPGTGQTNSATPAIPSRQLSSSVRPDAFLGLKL